MLNFGNVDTEIPLPNSTARCERCAWSAQSEKKKKKNWQTNCGNAIAEIQPKGWERRRKRWREKILNFDNVDTEIPLSNFAAGCERCAWSAQSEKKKKIWQTNCSNAIAEIGNKKIITIVAMALPKMGGKKKVVPKSGESKKIKCYVHNIFTINHMWLVIISLNLNLTLRLFF